MHKLLLILLVASAAMYFLAGRVLEADGAIDVINQMVESDERVRKEVGAVQAVKIVKRVAVGASPTTQAYRLYTVEVRGDAATKTLVIRLSGSDGNSQPTLDAVVQ